MDPWLMFALGLLVGLGVALAVRLFGRPSQKRSGDDLRETTPPEVVVECDERELRVTIAPAASPGLSVCKIHVDVVTSDPGASPKLGDHPNATEHNLPSSGRLVVTKPRPATEAGWVVVWAVYCTPGQPAPFRCRE